MFNPKTKIIEKIYSELKWPIEELENIFIKQTNVYIDYANVRPWSNRIGWNIDLKRLKQFLDSFDNIQSVKFYDGILKGDKKSEKAGKEKIKIFKDNFKTKPVKIMRHSIDFSSIRSDETSLLEQFIRKCLLLNYKIKTIEYLNEKFLEMNKNGKYYIEDRKCNFDVEIGRDMFLDYERNTVDTFILWSGDSDFYDPIKQLLEDNKKMVLFATSGRIAKELNDLQKDGLKIFDINKIREFICWKKQIYPINAKRNPCGPLKL
ncbi:NYN domain-containing protein [Patescibacteria group bacterium]|nr:NYN domain-containing protein [Patescibacteria group bacterium]